LTAANDARLSYAVGRLARQLAEYPRAETWFRRAILLGRQSGDWESYSMAFMGLGNLYLQRGSLPSAQKAHLRAYRAARRKGLRNAQGLALHELFVIAAQRNQVKEAEELAGAAVKAYGSKHPKLPSLASDVSVFWISQGFFAPALTVLEALLPHFHQPVEQAAVFANIAGATAGLHESERFDSAWQRGWELVTRTAVMEKTASVYLGLAQSAAAGEDWERTLMAAERAVEVATERQEAEIKMSAEALLEAAHERKLEKVQDEQVTTEPWLVDHADALAVNVAKSLNAGLAAR
ncbi:MAG: hypothetical protein JO040_11735, partial [Gemmatimonadetes bacterium]|nr:hypothetical protein [Gemmatimonadota bacterium]